MRNEKRLVEWEGGVEDRAGGVGAEARGETDQKQEKKWVWESRLNRRGSKRR